jgi:transposase
LVDTDGVPLGFEVYPGNTFEGKTLKDIVNKMKEKFKVRRFIFVADRGLFSKENLDELRKGGAEFLVGMRLGNIGKRRPEIYDRSQFTEINEDIAVLETRHQGDRCIVTWSKERAQRDANVRNDILAKIGKKLSGAKVTAKTFISNSNYRLYLTGLEKGETPSLSEEKIKEAASKDGFFAVITNVEDKTAAEIFFQYKQLWHIEDAFGELKGTLKARPIFHWKDERIVGHLTMCFIALLCETHITRLLRETSEKRESRAIYEKLIDSRQLSTDTVMKELCEIRAIPVMIKKKRMWIRTDIRGNAAKVFKRLGMRIPSKLLKTENVVAQTDASSIST